jgi:ABC-type molybdate transport system substrate-binding protein
MTADPIAPPGGAPPGVTVFCDPPLRPAMWALAPLAGVPVAVLSAPAPAMIEQIRRHTRDDVLVTVSRSMDRAASQNFVDPKTRIDGFCNPLVLAAAARFAGAALPAGARVAVTDNTEISGLDGAAVLAANGYKAARLTGTASTADAMFLLATGRVDAAVVYQTDARAAPGVQILATLTADPALTAFSAAVNANAKSPNAQALLNLMRAPAGAAALQSAGLEMPA